MRTKGKKTPFNEMWQYAATGKGYRIDKIKHFTVLYLSCLNKKKLVVKKPG